VLDGAIARKLNCQSKFGEKIDSLGDGVFIICAVTAAVFAIEQIRITRLTYVLFAILLIGRAVNMIFTWVKFRRVGFIHTRSTRWASIPMYVMLLAYVVFSNLPDINIFLAIFISLTTIAQLEETWILRAMQPGEYTMSIKSYWEWKRDRTLTIDIETTEKQEAIV
jgi:CDP-diacylglycerol--glycerol-3-phosphate 3-phosphatidyltransferase